MHASQLSRHTYGSEVNRGEAPMFYITNEIIIYCAQSISVYQVIATREVSQGKRLKAQGRYSHAEADSFLYPMNV